MMQSCGGEAPPDSSRYAGNAEQELDSELEELGEAGFHQQIVMQLRHKDLQMKRFLQTLWSSLFTVKQCNRV